MTVWPGSMKRNMASTDATQIILSTFRPGRVYTAEDVRLRCKDRGHKFSENAIGQALRKLIQERAVRVVRYPTGGGNKIAQIYALADIEPDDPGRDIVQPPSHNPDLNGEDPAAVPVGGNSRGSKGLDAAAGPAETRKGGQHSTPDGAVS